MGPSKAAHCFRDRLPSCGNDWSSLDSFKITVHHLIMFYATWKAFYAKIAAEQRRDVDAIAEYASIVTHGADATLLKHYLSNNEDELTALFPSSSGRIVTTHQFKYDVQGPLRKLGTNEVWSLCGGGASASVIAIPSRAFTTDVDQKTPKVDDILKATDVDDLKKLPTDRHTKFQGKAFIVVPPFLAVAMMEETANDPFTMLEAANQAIGSFDNDMQTADPDGWEDARTAHAALAYVIQWLWLVATDRIRGMGLEPLSHARAEAFVAKMKSDKRVDAASATNESVSADALTAARNINASVERLATATTRQNQILEQKATTEAASKVASTKIYDGTWRMMINASEPLPDDAQDADGNPITIRAKFVDTYESFLAEKTVGNASQHLHDMLNNKSNCATDVPMSTIVALYQVKVQWHNLTIPEAFSLLALYHVASWYPGQSGEDALRMALQTSEGDGLTPTDITKASKPVWCIPTTIDTVGKMLGVMYVVLVFVTGEKSELSLAVKEWTDTFQDEQRTLQAATDSDRLFPLKLACMLDKCIQLHLRECSRAATPDDVNPRWLNIRSSLESIQLGRFDFNIPQAIMVKVPTYLMSSISGKPSGPDGGKPNDQDQGRKRRRGRKAINHSMLDSNKISEDQIGFFITQLTKRNDLAWSRQRRQRAICMKYHGLGHCEEGDDCRMAYSHDELPDPLSGAFCKFVKKTRQALKDRKKADEERGTSDDSDKDGDKS